jgi:hypothetical protein
LDAAGDPAVLEVGTWPLGGASEEAPPEEDDDEG